MKKGKIIEELTKMPKEELDKVLENHKLWLNSDGREGEKADLSGYNLTKADLRGTDLRNTDLIETNLEYTNLSEVNLEGADLFGADLREANLEGANLIGANFFNTVGNGKEIITLVLPMHIVNMTKHSIQIGCENHTYEEWINFSDSKIESMDNGALNWWTTHKDTILSTYKFSNLT